MSAEGGAPDPVRGAVLTARAWPGLAGLGLGALALGPGLRRGFLLSYDMVVVPRQPFTAALAGLAGGPPRAVPSDAVVAAASRVLPADLVQKLLLLSIFVLACSGAAALLGRQPWFARLAAGLFYAWNPFVAERLIIGQWALLLGYAGLPWALRAVMTGPIASWRGAARLAVAMIPAIVGGFAAMAVTALVVVPAAVLARPPRSPGGVASGGASTDAGAIDPAEGVGSADGGAVGPAGGVVGADGGAAGPAGGVARVAGGTVGPDGGAAGPAEGTIDTAEGVVGRGRSGRRGRTRAAAGLAALGVLAVGSLPWLIPSLARPVYADPAGVAAFAARADTPFGSLGSLVMLGGMWNAQAVPAGYGGWPSVFWLALVLAAAAGYVTFAVRPGRWPGLGIAAVAGLVIAGLGITAPGRELLRTLGTLWPGFAVLRDGQQFTAPLALAEALGAGLLVAWVARAGIPAAAGNGAGPAMAASPGATAGLAAAVGPGAPGPGLPASAAPPASPATAASAGTTGHGATAARPGLAMAVLLLIAPVLLLPGLAWGAAGRLRPVWYPASWLTAAGRIDNSRAPGSVLLLPWTAYRRPAWNGGRALLDPWPRLIARPVIWNDGPLVGEVQMRADDPAARRLGAAIARPGPLTPALTAAGVRFVVADGGSGAASYAGRLPGCTVLSAVPGLVVYQVPAAGPHE